MLSAMAVTPSTAASAIRAAPVHSSPDEMKNAVDPYNADQDEIDRDNIVQQPRHEQNQRPANNGNERHHVMDNGGHPHREGLSLG
jgi:hypothetical protein